MTETRILRIQDPADLLAAVPYTLKFHPEESLVVLGVEGGSLSVRVDLPSSPADVAQALRDVVSALDRHAVRGVAAVAYTDDHELASRVVAELARRLGRARIRMALRADGRRWYPLAGSVVGSPAGGTPYNLSAHPFTAQAVYDGEVVLGSRDELADSLVGTDVDDLEAVARATEQAQRRTAGAQRQPLGPPSPEAFRAHLVAEGSWVRERVCRFLADRVPLTADEAGRMLAALQSIDVRDVAWSEMSRATALRHVELWRDLSRRASLDVLAPAAALLGFAAWLAGDGALAWCAVDRCRLADPGYRLAELLAAALVNAVPPTTWQPPPREALGLFAG